MMTQTLLPTDATKVSHIFEAAGLGLAPYKLVRIEKRTYQAYHGAAIQPGACCQFCATGIVYLFWLQSSDKKLFYVGSDCILKSGDAGLERVIAPFMAQHAKELRDEKDNYYITRFADYLKNENPTYFSAMTGAHPNFYHARLGKTMGDYQKWCYEHAGKTSRARMARKILVAMNVVVKYASNRSSKPVTPEMLTNPMPDAIIVRKTLFNIIEEVDDDIIYVV